MFVLVVGVICKCKMASNKSVCCVPVQVLYGPYDYSHEGDKFKVWRQDDLDEANGSLNASCTEIQKKDIGLKIYSVTPLQRESFLTWCKFVNSEEGKTWKETFVLAVKEYCDYLRNVRAVAKHDLGINRDKDVESANACQFNSMESDLVLDNMLDYYDMFQFAIMSDEWILAVIVLEHLPQDQFCRFVIHMMQNKYKAVAMLFFQQYDDNWKQNNLLSVHDLLYNTHQKFWRSFHPFIPYVFNQLCTTQQTLDDIKYTYDQLSTFSNTILLWSATEIKAKERWGTENYLDQKLKSFVERIPA